MTDKTENKIQLNLVESCNLGKLGSDGVALRINFALNANELKDGPHRHAVFGLSHELAQGLAQALAAMLAGAEPAKH